MFPVPIRKYFSKTCAISNVAILLLFEHMHPSTCTFVAKEKQQQYTYSIVIHYLIWFKVINELKLHAKSFTVKQ